MTYVWNENGNLVTFSTKERAKIFGISREPDKEITDEEWETNQGIVRLENGNIVLGYSEEEKKVLADQKKMEELAELDANMRSTDYVAIKIMEGAATKEEYAAIIAQRATWRAQINTLHTELGIESTGDVLNKTLAKQSQWSEEEAKKNTLPMDEE